jgi:hypothetical protein
MQSQINVGIASYGHVGKKRSEFIDKNQHLNLFAVCDRDFVYTVMIQFGEKRSTYLVNRY